MFHHSLTLLALLVTCLTFKVCCTYLLYFQKVNARLESLNGEYVKMSPIFFYNPDGMPIQVHTASVFFFPSRAGFFFVHYPQAAQLACVMGTELPICFPDTHTHKRCADTYF